MMRKAESRIWAATMALAFALGAWVLILSPVLSPSPYYGVEVLRAERTAGSIALVANFEKTDCTFDRLTVIASEAGETFILLWSDLDGFPEDHDRDAGEQTLRISIAMGERNPDWVEVRTRHDCDGELVDRVFAHIDIPEDLTE